MAVRSDKHKNQGRNRNLTITLEVLAVVLTFLETNMHHVCATHPCTKSQFWVLHGDGKISCEECPTCPPGQGLSPECGTNISAIAMVNCFPCKSGISYSTSDDTSSCRPCSTPCSIDQVVNQACTPTTDVKCAKQCKSKDRYYDDVDGCKFCSKCCGHEDVVKNECKEKLGTASNMICSFHSNASQCGSATASLPLTAITVPSTLSSLVSTSSTPLSTTAAVGSINNESTVSGSEQTSLPSFVVPTVAVGVLLVAGGMICLCYQCFKRRCSYLKDQGVFDPETGSGDSGNGSQQTYGVQSDGGEACKMLSKNKVETIKLAALTPSDSSEPLLQEESRQGDAKTASKLLCSLLEDNNALERICVCLDTRERGCGNYREVAQYYGFDRYEIKSVLEKHEGGPTKALIEKLATIHPCLTVQEFVRVVKLKTKRSDVIKRLNEYDLS